MAATRLFVPSTQTARPSWPFMTYFQAFHYLTQSLPFWRVPSPRLIRESIRSHPEVVGRITYGQRQAIAFLPARSRLRHREMVGRIRNKPHYKQTAITEETFFLWWAERERRVPNVNRSQQG